MKIEMTVRELMDRGLWQEACKEYGWSEWAVNEGMPTDKTVELTPRLMRELGVGAPEDPEVPGRQAALEFLALALYVATVVGRDDIWWEEKYDLVFSATVAERIRYLGFEPNYYDPDTSYEEDVTAYARAIAAEAARVRLQFRVVED